MNVRSESVILVAIVVVLVAAVVLQGGGQAAVNPGDTSDPVTDPGANDSSSGDIILPPVGGQGTDDAGDDGTDSPGTDGADVTPPSDDGSDVDTPTDTGTDVPTDDGTDVPIDDGTDVPTDDSPDVPDDDGTAVPPTDAPGGATEFTNEGTAIFVVDGYTVGSVGLEVADTPTEQERGLSGRDSLPAQAGMAFVFDQEYYVSMWMKDTTIPLDLIFVSADGVVTNVEQADPQPGVSDEQLLRYESDQPVMYVIAVNQGTADQLGVTAGATVEFDLP